jgi:hypothetical protein
MRERGVRKKVLEDKAHVLRKENGVQATRYHGGIDGVQHGESSLHYTFYNAAYEIMTKETKSSAHRVCHKKLLLFQSMRVVSVAS